MPANSSISRWLLVAFALETFCVTWGLKIPGFIGIFSVLYFITGISIPVLVTQLPSLKVHWKRKLQGRSENYYRLLAIILLGMLMYFQGRYWMQTVPIDVQQADMLPVIKVMDSRFIAGAWKFVYSPIPEIWGGTNPIYLPALWLPFVPAMVLHIDIRWTTVAGLLFAFSAFIYLLKVKKNDFKIFFLLIVAAALYWWLFTEEMHNFISMTEEGVVVAWYALLVIAVLTENILFIGIAASLCLLSRYAMIGWAPAYILYLLLKKERKKSFVFCLAGLGCLLILFIIPFGLQPFKSMIELPGRYVQFTGRVWRDGPAFFSESMGFAKFFGPSHIGLQHYLLEILSIILPIGFVLYCFYRGKRKTIENIPLATIKLSIVVFYNLIDVPYLYLFYTSSFVSLLIMAAALAE